MARRLLRSIAYALVALALVEVAASIAFSLAFAAFLALNGVAELAALPAAFVAVAIGTNRFVLALEATSYAALDPAVVAVVGVSYLVAIGVVWVLCRRLGIDDATDVDELLEGIVS